MTDKLAGQTPKNDWKDGDDLGGGLVFSGRGGYAVAVYRCSFKDCGKEQTALHPNFPGGISSDTAKRFGWEQSSNGDWGCPFCTGNEDKLDAIFNAPLPPKEH